MHSLLPAQRVGRVILVKPLWKGLWYLKRKYILYFCCVSVHDGNPYELTKEREGVPLFGARVLEKAFSDPPEKKHPVFPTKPNQSHIITTQKIKKLAVELRAMLNTRHGAPRSFQDAPSGNETSQAGFFFLGDTSCHNSRYPSGYGHL